MSNIICQCYIFTSPCPASTATTSSPCAAQHSAQPGHCGLNQSASHITTIINSPCEKQKSLAVCDLWDKGDLSIVPNATVTTVPKPSRKKQTNLAVSEVLSARIDPNLPFSCSEDMEGFTVAAKPILKPTLLKTIRFTLPSGKCFLDKTKC